MDNKQNVEPKSQNFEVEAKKTVIATESTNSPKRLTSRKVIAAILGILLLVIGIGAGVLLVQQNQEIRERAAGTTECVQSPNCTLLDEPENKSIYKTDRSISHIFITGRDVYKFEQGVSDDGCYRVTISKNLLMWEKHGSESSCKDIVTIQIWLHKGSSTN